jgi:hypothetical protein
MKMLLAEVGFLKKRVHGRQRRECTPSHHKDEVKSQSAKPPWAT